MLSQVRVEEIHDLAANVNATSEKYQLIHAMFAIEKIFKDVIETRYLDEFNKIRDELKKPGLSEDAKLGLMQQAKELKEDANKKIKILVDYIPQMRENSARITQTQNNTFLIVLPKSMARTRGENGKIDFEMLKKLRKLMAHELGHIVLHSGVLAPYGDGINEGSEEEAELFAEQLITLRRARNSEIYDGQHFQDI